MPDFTDLADRHIAMWNETDAKRRCEIIAGVWTEQARCIDPLTSGNRPCGIDAMVQGVQQRFPGHKFRPTGNVDADSHCARFGWGLGPSADAPPLAAGVDFGVVAADRRSMKITDFLDRAAHAA